MRSDESEDLFAETRMSFGDHIEELRTHLLRAIYGLVIALVGGLSLDGIGWMLDKPWIGVGFPMMQVIKAPVSDQLRAFYNERIENLKKASANGEATAMAITKPKTVKIGLSPDALAKLTGKPVPERADTDATPEPVWVEVLMEPLGLYSMQRDVNNVIRPPELSTLTVTEGMTVYFKVCIASSLVLASPWVFWQLWSFVAAGMYPHEKRYVHKFLPISVGLFLFGVILCQYAVLPRSVEALLWFNQWLGLTPDLRLNDWLSFAIMLPVVFGAAFQTPLVMLFLERIGVMTVATYISYWKVAVMVMAVFAAVITPTPDIVTWGAMLAPMCGLYVLGIWLCKLSPRAGPGLFDPSEADDTLVGV